MKQSKDFEYRLSEKKFFTQFGLVTADTFIPLDRYKTTMRVQTVGDGSPILLMHGAPNAGSSWAELVSLLPDQFCMMPDRPGCGLSEPLDSSHFTPTQLAEFVVYMFDAILDHFNLDEVPVIASSFGGYLSLIYTFNKPERVSSLILEGCPATMEEKGLPTFMKWMMKPIFRRIIPKLPTSKMMFLKILSFMGHSYSVKHQKVSEAFVEWYVSLFNHTKTQENELQLINRIFPSGELNPQYKLTDADIEQIDNPTLMIWGDRDPFGGTAVAEKMEHLMPHAALTTVSNSGHLPWIDQPELNARTIRDFLAAA